MKSILDKSFRYTPSTSTDIRATFRRIRADMKRQAERSNVQPLKVKGQKR